MHHPVKSILLKMCLACAALLACALEAAPMDGVVVIANKSVQPDSVTAAALKDVYTGRMTYWKDGQSVIIAVLADNTDAALKEISGMDDSQFRTFWQRLVFSGRGQQPRKADNAAALVALVASTKGAVAIVPADTETKGVKKLEVK
jgi:ABC-type phosphate transport system substrate-binding protein